MARRPPNLHPSPSCVKERETESPRLKHECFYIPLGRSDHKAQLIAKMFEKIVLRAIAFLYVELELALQTCLVDHRTVEHALQPATELIDRTVNGHAADCANAQWLHSLLCLIRAAL